MIEPENMRIHEKPLKARKPIKLFRGVPRETLKRSRLIERHRKSPASEPRLIV
jgi:hypothetical protein